MIGIDTNLLVRLYVQDDPAQTPVVFQTLREAAPVFVPKSVVLELFWVLTSVYELPRARLILVLRHLTALDDLRIEDEDAIISAVDYYERGIEFEDAVHLASARHCTRFLTFDRPFIRRAKRLKLSPECVEPKA